MLELAIELSKGAGRILQQHYGSLRRHHAQRKEGRRRDLVSVADVEAEKYLLAGIPAADRVLGEETGRHPGDSARQWIIDPLDGTVNFLHGLPFWCVSIGILEDDLLSAAVIHAPALGQTFTARSGECSRLNGAPIRVSTTADLEEAILASGFAYDRNQQADNNLDNWVTMGLAAAGLRRLGSAALDCAYTASGCLDGYWELHLHPWDVAAGILVVRQAGGRVSDFRGSEDLQTLLYGRNIVASNAALHEQILQRLATLKAL